MAKTILKLTIKPSVHFLANVKTVYQLLESDSGDYIGKYSGLNEDYEKVSSKSVISKSHVDQMLASLTNITIQAFPVSEMIFCDGNFVELEINTGRVSANYEWHVEPPNEWKQLSDIADQLQHLVENNLSSEFKI